MYKNKKVYIIQSCSMEDKVHIETVPVVVYKEFTFPKSYDLRSKVSPPVNQGSCGSCWAIAAVQCVEDRLRLKHGKSKIPTLSYQHVNDCSSNCVIYRGRKGCSNDCRGGFLTSAFEFIRTKGVLSAADYKAKFGEVHGSLHVGSDVRSKCSLQPGHEKMKRWKIDGYYHVMLFPHLYGISNAREVHPILNTPDNAANTKNIQEEIYRNGPVATCFNMFSDFSTFASHNRGEEEVYSLGWETPDADVHPVGDMEWSTSRPGPGNLIFVTGHAVSIVGWGVTPRGKVPYWWVKNSWGMMGGFIKVLRGENCSAIESDVEAPRVNHNSDLKKGQGKKKSWWSL
jgi:cathepsin B